VHDREIAKDILQDAFTNTWKYVCGGKEINNMKSFLYKTLNNLIIDYYRKKKTISLDALMEDGYDPNIGVDVNFSEHIDGERAIMLIDKLAEPYREAVFLRYVNNLDISEISDITGETENAVSVHVHRGLNKLKELFEHEK